MQIKRPRCHHAWGYAPEKLNGMNVYKCVSCKLPYVVHDANVPAFEKSKRIPIGLRKKG